MFPPGYSGSRAELERVLGSRETVARLFYGEHAPQGSIERLTNPHAQPAPAPAPSGRDLVDKVAARLGLPKGTDSGAVMAQLDARLAAAEKLRAQREDDALYTAIFGPPPARQCGPTQTAAYDAVVGPAPLPGLSPEDDALYNRLFGTGGTR